MALRHVLFDSRQLVPQRPIESQRQVLQVLVVLELEVEAQSVEAFLVALLVEAAVCHTLKSRGSEIDRGYELV